MDLRPLGEEILELVNAGVSGIVMKDSSFDECVATVRAVASSERILPPMTDTLVGDSISATGPVRRAPPSVSLLMRGRTGATQHAPNLTSEMTADLGRFPGSFAFLFLRSSIECAE